MFVWINSYKVPGGKKFQTLTYYKIYLKYTLV